VEESNGEIEGKFDGKAEKRIVGLVECIVGLVEGFKFDVTEEDGEVVEILGRKLGLLVWVDAGEKEGKFDG